MRASALHKVMGYLVMVAIICLAPAVFGSVQSGQAGKSTQPNPNANQFGELSGVWWQWIFSFPSSTSPNFSNGLVDCSFGQYTHTRSNQIWFLAGSFGGPADRTCTTPIPHGISLFFPLLNIAYDNINACDSTTPPTTYGVQQLKQLAAAAQDNPQELHASVDGVPVPAYRAQSQVFSYTLPATDNFYQHFGCTVPGVNWPSTTSFPVVSDGYWVMLENLSPGPHVVKFGGIGNNGFSVDITYHLTVAP